MGSERPPDGRDFHGLLDWHLERGTRPGKPPLRWTHEAFAAAVKAGSRESVTQWVKDTVPQSVTGILDELFGADRELAAERKRMEAAWAEADSARRRRGRRAAAPSFPSTTIPRPERCFGRDDLVARIAAALAPGAAVLILGEGGIGKTTVARQAALRAAVATTFGPRRFEAMLDAAQTATDLAASIARAIGSDPAQGLDATLAALAAAPTLLLLDNLETCWEADRAAVQAVLARLGALPGLALLVTLRGGEAPRGLSITLRESPAPLPRDKARRLFLAIAPKVAADPALDTLLDEAGGLPLAITLLAYRAEPESSLAPLLAEWCALGTAAVRDPQSAAATRQSALDASIRLSLASPRLGDAGRKLFRLLGALPAGLCNADAEALLGADFAGACRQLLAVGLAHRDTAARLDLLPPLRRHARDNEQLSEEERRAAFGHLFAVVKGLARHVMQKGVEVNARLAPEVPNIEVALNAAACDPSLLAAVGNVAWTYARVCRSTGHLGAALHACASAAQASGNALVEANCVVGLAEIDFSRSRYSEAAAAYGRAEPIFARVREQEFAANCIARLADIALRSSDFEKADLGFNHAGQIYDTIGSALGRARCILGHADVAFARSNVAAASEAYDEALMIFSTSDRNDTLGRAHCTRGLADVALTRSDFAKAESGYTKARRLYVEVGHVLGEANCIKGLADIALARSDHAAGAAGYAEARPLYARVGDVLGEANCIQGLANIALRRSDLAAAAAGYAEARPLYARVGAVHGEAICLTGFADLARAQGDRAEARRLYEQALSMEERTGHAHNAAITRRRLAALDAEG